MKEEVSAHIVHTLLLKGYPPHSKYTKEREGGEGRGGEIGIKHTFLLGDTLHSNSQKSNAFSFPKHCHDRLSAVSFWVISCIYKTELLIPETTISYSSSHFLPA